MKSSHQFALAHRTFLRRWLSQGTRDLLNRMAGLSIVYRGKFQNWDQAVSAARGYDDDELLERIHQAALSVRNGQAAWEQDGVIREGIEPDLPILANLALVAAAHNGNLSVLDFGGGFGSSYHQFRAFAPDIGRLSWRIVEQPRMVKLGLRDFSTDQLSFHYSLEEATTDALPDIVILSSVLQYLPDPHETLASIMSLPIKHLIIDRHPVSSDGEKISVQVLPRSIYPASYPSWIFDREKMWAAISRQYGLVMEWTGKDPDLRGSGLHARFVGAHWKRYALD